MNVFYSQPDKDKLIYFIIYTFITFKNGKLNSTGRSRRFGIFQRYSQKCQEKYAMCLTDKPFWFILPDITLNNSGLIFTVKTKMNSLWKYSLTPLLFFSLRKSSCMILHKNSIFFNLRPRSSNCKSHDFLGGIWGYKRPSKLIIQCKIICLSKIWKLDGVHGEK